jgi:hypothetical protein
VARTPIKSPLTESHYTQLKNLKNSIAGTKAYIAKCKKCRLEVEQEEKTTDEQLEIVNALLREFFPEKPQ